MLLHFDLCLALFVVFLFCFFFLFFFLFAVLFALYRVRARPVGVCLRPIQFESTLMPQVIQFILFLAQKRFYYLQGSLFSIWFAFFLFYCLPHFRLFLWFGE